MLEEHGLTLPPEKQPCGASGAGTDQLALEGPGGHAGGVEKAEAAALGAPGPHPVAVAEVGSGRVAGAAFRRCYNAATWERPRSVQCGRRCRFAPPEAFHSVGCSGDNRVTFWLFQRFAPRNLEDSRPPNPGLAA